MLGQIADGDDEEAARPVRDPGIVRLRVRYLRRKVKASVPEFPDVPSHTLEDVVEVHRSIRLSPGERRSVPVVQDVDAHIVGEEGPAGMEAGRGGEGTAAGRTAVV